MGLKLKVLNIGIEGMEYVSVFNLKMPSGMHVIVKDVLVITYLYDSGSLCVTPPSGFNVIN